MGVTIMVDSVLNSLSPLSILLFFLGIGVVLTSSLMYYAEKTKCPDVRDMIAKGTFDSYAKECYEVDTGWTRTGDVFCCTAQGAALDFPSIRGSFWWSIVTMTTVGYGDHVPRTLPGQLVGCLAMLTGIVLISLPVAIVGSKFQLAYEALEEEKRQLLITDEEERLKLMETEGISPQSVPSGLSDPSQLERKEGRKSLAPPDASTGPTIDAYGSERNSSVQAAASQLNAVRGRLKYLETKDGLSEKSLDELNLLLEMFDHVERVEKQLKKLREKDVVLDGVIRKEFGSLLRGYDAHRKGLE